jgi:hypothetical protein
MSTQTVEATDLELLVGDMPEVPCEGNSHGKDPIHPDAGPATHYALVTCKRCQKKETKAYCLSMVHYIQDNGYLLCFQCKNLAPAMDVVTILGPVKQ